MSGHPVPRRRAVVLRGAQMLLLAFLLLGEVRGQSSVLSDAPSAEARLKAAFVCKFGNYVEWPDAAKRSDEPFVIGALASDSVVRELTRAAAGQVVNGRPIAVKRLLRGDSLEGLAVVYVGRTESERLAEVLVSARGRPILTVTESDAAGGDGGMVNFVVVEDRVRFDIALPAAERSSLKISGRLLALARKVTGAPS
jgi:hypothetical protein